MKSAFRMIPTLRSLDYLLVLRRKLFWIVIPGLLAGVLATIIAPGSEVSESPISSSLKPVAAQTEPSDGANSQPNRLLIIFVSITIGLAIGVSLALFLEFRNGWARSEPELARLIRIPVLASIPHIEDQKISS